MEYLPSYSASTLTFGPYCFKPLRKLSWMTFEIGAPGRPRSTKIPPWFFRTFAIH
jgi:hypothetical protein